MKNIKQTKITKPKVGTFLKLIVFYYLKYFSWFVVLFLITIISAGCSIAIPKLTQFIINKINGDLSTILTLSSIAISVFIAKAIAVYFNLLIGGKIGKKIEISLRQRILKTLTNLDLDFYTHNRIGDLLTKLISDTQIIGTQSQTIPQNILSALVVTIGSIVILFSINIKLTLISIGLIALLLFFLTLSYIFLKRSILVVRKTITGINADVTDRINNIRLIKALGTQEHENKRFQKLHVRYYDASKKQINYQAIMIAFLIVFLTSINIFILVAGVLLLHFHELYWSNNPLHYDRKQYVNAISVIVASMTGVSTLVLPMLSISRLFTLVAQASASSQRVSKLINQKAKIKMNLHTKEIKKISAPIIFKNVSFGYDKDDLILKNFNYTFDLGKKYAIVGETGVGKTTIAKLLLRFYDPIEGEILINNQPLNKLNLKSYLKLIGYVEQEPQMFNDNFIKNIKYGSFSKTDAEIIESAKKAHLNNFILKTKKKYNTFIGESGSKLSGGQKQRLVIARNFLRNPQILILDEATSSLDNIVEKRVQEQLDELMKNKTTFVIAHRLSTIKNADLILVLAKQQGIVQIGKFDQLINKSGHFQEIYNAGLLK